MTFDLGEARRKRGVQEREMVITSEDGEVEAKYRIVGTIPVAFMDHGTAGNLSAAFRDLFVDPVEAEDFMERYKPGLEDLAAILEDLFPGLGSSVGESLASGLRSTSTSTS